MSEALHLVKVPLRAEKLAAIARQQSLPLRNLDDGYLCHRVLRKMWADEAPAPFVLRGQGRDLHVWGYSRVDAVALADRARVYGDPSLLGALGDLEMLVSKPMPTLEAGRRVGFLLRACPVVRLARGATGHHRPGAEVDAFLARCFHVDADTAVSREDVYREWLLARLNRSDTTGVSVDTIRVASFARERVVRRTQGETRVARTLERPDVRFEGTLTIVDGTRFTQWLAHGVGRHRAFGFGALILVPPGTQHAS